MWKILLVVTLIGCAPTVWTHPTKSVDEAQRECVYQIDLKYMSTSYSTRNTFPRAEFEGCMKAKGFSASAH